MIASYWKIFEKAGQPGWACIVPIYSMIVMLKIINKPLIWLLWFFIPIVNLFFIFRIPFLLAKSFGKDTGYGFGILFLGFIFIPMLAFGDAQYMKEEINTSEFGKPVTNTNFENR
ncbi:MAG TPA: DUF5684 domain-containing protein [Cytophagaceae bacterium]|nr:DUF5684 domain-containing protein [Cytophagaceae bacterium]